MRALRLIALASPVAAALGQPVSVDVGAEAPATVQPGIGQRVRSIDVRGTWWPGIAALPLAVCDVLTRENLSASFDAL